MFTKECWSDIILSGRYNKLILRARRGGGNIFARFIFMKIIPIAVGDTLTLKKKHPCGSDSFTVTRIGSDIGMRCSGCSRDVMTPRVKLEKSIKRVNGVPAQELTAAAEKEKERITSDSGQ